MFEENGKLKADNERLSKEFKTLETSSKDVVRKTEINESRSRLDKLMKEGFTDKQKKFIVDRFNPEKQEDLSETGLNKYIEEGKKDFTETAKIFGAEAANDTKGSGNNNESEDDDMERQALEVIGAIDSKKS